MPLREHGAGSRRELHARVSPRSQALVEPVQRHRHEVREDVALELGQRPMGFLVLHVQPMEAAVLGQTSIAQQRPYEDRSLPASEVLRA